MHDKISTNVSILVDFSVKKSRTATQEHHDPLRLVRQLINNINIICISI